MEDLPATLDDAELWRSSGIFPAVDDQQTHRLHHDRPHYHRPISGGVSRMDDLNRRFRNFNLLDRHRIINPNVPAIPEQLGVYVGMAERVLTAPSTKCCHRLRAGATVDSGLSNYPTPPSNPVHPFPVHTPVQTQAAHFRFGCATRSHRSATGGTGVFIPRATSVANNGTSQGNIYNKGKLGVTSHKDPAKKLVMRKPEEYYYHK